MWHLSIKQSSRLWEKSFNHEIQDTLTFTSWHKRLGHLDDWYLTKCLRVSIQEKAVYHFFIMTSSPIPGHQPWGQNLWNVSRPSKIPMTQVLMLSDEWLPRYTHLRNFNAKLGGKFHKCDRRTYKCTNIWMERWKLYMPQHTSYAVGYIGVYNQNCQKTVCMPFKHLDLTDNPLQ